MRALRECGFLKYFRVPEMKASVHLLEQKIHMWDPEQNNFVVGTHTLSIDIDDIYFLTGLSRRGRQVVLTSPRGGDASLDDMIDLYRLLGTLSQGVKSLLNG